MLTLYRCLTEGVDVPNIDCIVFADPRKSKVDIVQALGRALRKKDGKDWGYVILPVIYDGETNEIDNDNFNEILSIVRGLAANDERIIEYFKDKSLGKGKERSGGAEVFSMISDTLSESDFAEQLSIRIWEKLSRFNWMPYQEAREFARSLNLTTVEQWYKLKGKRPSNIPSRPQNNYILNGWTHWGDFLGIKNWKDENEDWMPFKEAREYVRSLGLKNVQDWYDYLKSDKLPSNIPNSPAFVYKINGWQGNGDWIGTDRIADQFRKYLSFEVAMEYMKANNIRSLVEWKIFKNNNNIENIPSKLYRTYSDKWKNEAHFFDRELFTYKEAKAYIKEYKVKSSRDYAKFIDSENYTFRLPPSPYRKYKGKGWVDWADFLCYVKAKRGRPQKSKP